MRALVINDTRRGKHPGCMLVMRQLLDGCRSAGILVSRTLSLGWGFRKAFRKEVEACDLVIINGEGTMHHDKPGALALTEAGVFAHKCGKPIALINTVWEGNHLANELLQCASIVAARESYSAEEIRCAGFNAEVVPDLVMSSCVDHLYPAHVSAPGSVVVLDDVRWEMALLLARYAHSRGFQFLRMAPRPSWHSTGAMMRWGQLCIAGGMETQFRLSRVRSIKDASIVVTGRFHGACLAILAEKPFVAISSNTHKIQGLLADARLGACAMLLCDSELEREPFKLIDEAIMQVRDSARVTRTLDSYQQSCRCYSEIACTGATLLFKSIAALIQKRL